MLSWPLPAAKRKAVNEKEKFKLERQLKKAEDSLHKLTNELPVDINATAEEYERIQSSSTFTERVQSSSTLQAKKDNAIKNTIKNDLILSNI